MQKIFNYINEGEELVVEPFQRLIAQEELIAYKYDGFWACMDTFRDKQMFDDMHSQGKTIWEVWKTPYKLGLQSTVLERSRLQKELVTLNGSI